MKLEARSRLLLSAPSSDPIIAAAEWLDSWVEQSWSIPAQYTAVPWVVNHLKALKKLVPFTPQVSSLYRVVGTKTPLKVGQSFDLPANKLQSFTTKKGKAHWEPLADQVGARDLDFCYALEIKSPIVPIFDTAWVFGPVLKYIKTVDKDVYASLNSNKGYVWQKEVVGYAKSKIKASVIADISY